jgi:glutaredoxin
VVVVASVVVLSRPGCHLCEEAMKVLRELQARHDFELQERDITEDEVLHRRYFERIPVVRVDGEDVCEYFVNEAILRERLESRR